jgi:hypothetical protein
MAWVVWPAICVENFGILRASLLGHHFEKFGIMLLLEMSFATLPLFLEASSECHYQT